MGVDFISKFDMTKEQLLADPVVRRTLDESFLGRNAGVLPVPVFAYHATMGKHPRRSELPATLG